MSPDNTTAKSQLLDGKQKYLLLQTIRKVLGPAYSENVGRKLDSVPNTRQGLESALDACCKLVRLTIDEKMAQELARQGRSIIEKM